MKNKPEIRFKGFTDDWEQRKLSDGTSKIGDGLHGTPRYSEDGDVFFINGNNLMNGKIVITGETKLVTESEQSKDDKSLDTNTILMSINGTIGNLAWYNNEKVMLGKSAAYLTVSEFDKKFIYSFLQTSTIKNYFLNNLTGTTIKNLGLKTIRDTTLFVPVREEQQKIGAFFKQLDDTIALHQRKLELLKEQKKGFLQKMFPKPSQKVPEIRFEGFTDDWEQRKWMDTVEMSTNMVDPKSGKYDDLFHIGPGNIESFTGRILDNVNTVKNDNLISGKFHFQPNDIIYGKINPQLAKYAHVNFEGLASADAYVLNSKNGIDQDFLFVELQTSGFYKYSVSVSMRTGMPKINRDELNQFSYLAPKYIEEQQKIGQFFKQLDDTIALHQQKLELLKKQKQSLLQRMFV